MQATTILALRRNGQVVMVGDGQVTLGDVVMKHRARKIRRLHHDTVLAGFAGSAADGITLLDRFEAQLQQTNGQLRRAAVDLAKEWRTDRFLRRLEAYLLAASVEAILCLSGDGEVIELDVPFRRVRWLQEVSTRDGCRRAWVLQPPARRRARPREQA